MRRSIILAALLASTLLPGSAFAGEGKKKGGPGGEGGVPLEPLLKFNEREIFGGTLTLQGGDKFEVLFDKAGQMAKGFEAQGAPIIDEGSPEAVGGNRRFIAQGEGVVPGLAALGLGPQGKAATWTSRFPVGGDVKVSFNFRIPNLLSRQSTFNVRLNSDRGTYLEAEWFTTIAKRSGGKTVGNAAVSAHPQYKPVITDWYPKKEAEGVGIEFAVEGRKFISRIRGTEVAVLDKGKDAAKGKVVFVFSRVAFTLQSLKISGDLDRPWCEKQVADLEKKGKLLRKAPEAPPPPADPGAAPAPGDEPGRKKAEKEKKGDDESEL